MNARSRAGSASTIRSTSGRSSWPPRTSPVRIVFRNLLPTGRPAICSCRSTAADGLRDGADEHAGSGRRRERSRRRSETQPARRYPKPDCATRTTGPRCTCTAASPRGSATARRTSGSRRPDESTAVAAGRQRQNVPDMVDAKPGRPHCARPTTAARRSTTPTSRARG